MTGRSRSSAAAEACRSRSRTRSSGAAGASCCFAIRGWADAGAVARYPHHWVAVGQIGRVPRLARRGGLPRHRFHRHAWCGRRSRRCDSTARRCGCCRGSRAFFAAATTICFPASPRSSKSTAFALLGAHEVAPEILMPEGALGRACARQRARSCRHRARARDCCDARSVRHRPGGRRGRQSRARGRGGRRDRPMLARVAELRASGRMRAGWRAACWSRRRSPTRTGASICRRSARKRSRARRAPALPALRSSPAARSSPSPSGSRTHRGPRRLFVLGVREQAAEP